MENVYQHQVKESMSERHGATELLGSVQPGSGGLGPVDVEDTCSPKNEVAASKKVVKIPSDEHEYADLSG